MKKAIDYFFNDSHFKLQTVWFRRLLYLFLIIKVIYWLYYFDLLFGDHSIIYLDFNSIGTFKNLAFLLLKFPGSYLNLLFIISVLFLAFFGLFVSRIKFSLLFLSNFLLWFLVINIHNRLYPTLSGGNFLLNQFLLFNCFLIPIKPSVNETAQPLQIALHNTAVIGLLIQISLVYFLSGLAKLNDADWLNGEAVKYTMQVKHFTLFNLNGKVWDVLSAFLNYSIVIYQLSFPFAVWIKRIKKPYLLFGVLMHLYIAFFMGLPEFGIVMLLAYLYFWPFKNRVS